MKRILGIDPGTYKSAYVILRGRVIEGRGTIRNDLLLDRLSIIEADVMAIEMFTSYGQKVGMSSFETCVWIGRFIERWPGPWLYVYRKKRGVIESVTIQMCGTTKVKDADVKQAVLDHFPATGGGKTPQVGTKAKPGPLFGMVGHEFQALAVALTYQECRSECDSV